MNVKAETTTNPFDLVKMVLALAVLLGGIVAYYWFEDASQLLRVAGVLLAVVLSIVLFMQTQMGRELWEFIQGSRVEIRKVIWPNRQETMQTTIAVIGFTIIMGVFFWLLDMFLSWASAGIVSYGGA
ncbi:MAG: preprotein translocase subunit SecE [Gammaproteobacteria bacterium]|nr:preprotein translocase subunit SecE [Gammaproteobacteria bacterium]